VAIQGNNKTRSLVWEDEAHADSRFRRVQQGAPVSGRGLPGMPLEMQDPDGDDSRRVSAPRTPWWRPAGPWGRFFLALCALAVVSSFAVSVYLLKSYLERDARFRIAGTANIQATGLAEVSRADMLPVFGEDIGRNIFFIPLGDRRRQLEKIPWVERATVMRLLPDQIRVAVVERQPVAFVRQGQQIGLVDANGILLSMPAAMMAQRHYSFPVITGIDGGDPQPSRKARMAVYQRLVGELDANGQHLSDQISEIDLTDPEDARVLMPEQGADILAHFGEDHFIERYQRYKAHIAEWRQQYPKLASVDLRYDQQVVLQMVPGAGTDQAAVNTGDGQPAPSDADKAPAIADPPKPVASKPAEKKKPAVARAPASAKAAAKKNAVAKQKKRAEVKRIALKRSQHKPAPKSHPPSVAGQGK
jgi:cell division protein FtsQ